MDFICVTYEGSKRWINIYEIAALEEDENTIIYLKGNPNVHIACDQPIGQVIDQIMSIAAEAEAP